MRGPTSRLSASVMVLLLGLLALASMPVGHAKVITGKTTVRSGRAIPLTKFSFNASPKKEDRSTVSGWFEYRGETDAQLHMFMDTGWWESYHNQELDVCDRMAGATTTFNLGATDGTMSGVGEGGFVREEEMKNGLKRWHFNWTIYHAMRTYGWYFVLADCKDWSPEKQADLDELRIKHKRKWYRGKKMTYQLEMLNLGESHLPADEYGLPTTYALIAFGMTSYAIRGYMLHRKSNGGTSHLAVTLFWSAYIMQLLSLFCELWHLHKYMSDGKGSWIIDFFSEVLEGFSQSFLSFLLICLASGWTLTSRASGSEGGGMRGAFHDPQSMLRPDSPAIILLFLMPIVVMLLQFVNKWSDDDFLKFHDHESVTGKILVLLRMILGIVYIRSLNHTIDMQRGTGGGFVMQFLTKLRVFGSIWFLSFPVLVLVAGFLAHYLRHRLVTGGVMILQTGCLVALGEQFLSESSIYFRISSMSSFGFLPGAGYLSNAFSKDKGF